MVTTRTSAVRREVMGGLAKGLAVIRAFGRDHAALSLSDIARSAGIPAATARRCLLTLEELGYVTVSTGYEDGGFVMLQKDNPEAFANALTGVYATDPNYGFTLNWVMQNYGLSQYDH